MAVPKHKTSKSKRDKRRTHKKIDGITLSACPECGEAVEPHHACQSCGFYKGRAVITPEDD